MITARHTLKKMGLTFVVMLLLVDFSTAQVSQKSYGNYVIHTPELAGKNIEKQPEDIGKTLAIKTSTARSVELKSMIKRITREDIAGQPDYPGPYDPFVQQEGWGGWGSEIPINTLTADQKATNMACDRDNNLYVVFEDYNYGYYDETQTATCITIYQSNDGGQTWAWRGGYWYPAGIPMTLPTIAYANGYLFISFNADNSLRIIRSAVDLSGFDVFDPGISLTHTITPPNDVVMRARICSDAELFDNNILPDWAYVYLVYLFGNSSGVSEVYFTYTRDDGVSWATHQHLGSTYVSYYTYEVGLDWGLSGLYVSYLGTDTDQNHIKLRKSMDFGETFSSEMTFRGDAFIDEGNKFGPVVAAHWNAVLIAFQFEYEGGDNDILALYTEDDGASWYFQVIAGGFDDERFPWASHDNVSNYYVTYNAAGEIYAKLGTGTPAVDPENRVKLNSGSDGSFDDFTSVVGFTGNFLSSGGGAAWVAGTSGDYNIYGNYFSVPATLAAVGIDYDFEAVTPGTNPSPNTYQFLVENSGFGTLNVTISESATWLSVSPASFSLNRHGWQWVDVTATTSGLTAGSYSETITVSSDGGTASGTATVIVSGDEVPVLAISSGSITHDFGSVVEGINPNPNTYSFTIQNTGEGTLDGTVTESVAWLSLSSTSFSLGAGAIETITVTATTSSLTPGDYSEIISVTSNGGNASGDVTVTVTAAQVPVLAISSGSITHDFSSVVEGNNPNPNTYSFTIQNTGEGTLDGTVTESVAWLSLSSTSFSLGAGATETITVTAATSSLTPGDYSETISVTSNGGNASGDVTVTVTQPPNLAISSGTISHDFGSVVEGNDPSPNTYTFTVQNTGGGTLDGTVTESVAWLSLSSTSFSLGAGATETITVTAATSSLTPGDYSETISVTSNGGDAQGTVTVLIEPATVEQVITFAQAGWYIISLYVDPANPDLKAIVQPLIDAGALVKVQDEAGQAIEDVPGIGWINNIGNNFATEGYYLKVNVNANLYTTGPLVQLPVNIPLTAGWNIISYPVESVQDAQGAVQPLITEGSLVKVQDETGAALEDVPGFGWVNTIGNFAPGEGYYLKVGQATSLDIDMPAQAPQQVAGRLHIPQSQPVHFVKSWTGHPFQPMNIYLRSDDWAELVPPAGCEIGVFDGDLLVGATRIDQPPVPDAGLMLVATANDPLTSGIDGFISGHPITLKLWDGTRVVDLNPTALTGADDRYDLVFEGRGTAVGLLRPGILAIGDVSLPAAYALKPSYPNPFNSRTKLRFDLPEDAYVKLEILDIRGEHVRTLTAASWPAGSHEFVWQGDDDGGRLLPSGIYLYWLTAGEFSAAQKVLYLK